MLKKILPLLLLLVGAGMGIGIGIVLRPAPEEMLMEAEDATAAIEDEEVEELVEYVKMNNQFVVPIVKDSNRSIATAVTLP
jgi:flagellar FliL protein